MANKKYQVASVVNDEIMGACVSADVVADEMGNVFITANIYKGGNSYTVRDCADVDGGGDMFAALMVDGFARAFRVCGVRRYNIAAAQLINLLTALTVDAMRDEIAAGNERMAGYVRGGFMRSAFAAFVC